MHVTSPTHALGSLTISAKTDKELAVVGASREGIQKAGRTLSLVRYNLCGLEPCAFFTYFFFQ